jgi:hypothetical protein
LSLAGGSRLSVELGGVERGMSYDAVDVASKATIESGASLQVSRWGEFIPLPGQVFDVMQYGERDGMFASVQNNTGLAGLSFTADYTLDRLQLVAGGRPGDATLDALVDFSDLLILAQHYDLSVGQTWLEGDFTGDGAVQFDDLLLLAQQYGVAGLAGSSFEADWQLARSLVPEPASALLVLGAAIHRRRRTVPH